jgi:hypothetical protein
MHEDRDNYIILITLLPLVLFIGLYATWRSAGEPALGIPSIPFPTITLPVMPDLQPYIPSAVTSWIRNVQRNADTIFPALGVGLFMGLIGMGACIDLVKKLWRFAIQAFEAQEGEPTEDVSSEDVTQAAL